MLTDHYAGGCSTLKIPVVTAGDRRRLARNIAGARMAIEHRVSREMCPSRRAELERIAIALSAAAYAVAQAARDPRHAALFYRGASGIYGRCEAKIILFNAG